MRLAGFVLVVAAWVLLAYGSLEAPAYARAHPQLGAAMISEYAGAWPVALGCVVAGCGIVLAALPMRRGERWARWTLLAMFLGLLITRLATDPRCLVAMDPHQHGCHTFIIGMILGAVGVVLAQPRSGGQ